MKKSFRIGLIVIISLALCCVAVFAIAKTVDFVSDIVDIFKKETSEPQTEKYKDYVCVDANLTFSKSDVIDLGEKYRSKKDGADFYYYQIDGFDTKEMVAAEAFAGFAVSWGYDSQLILTDPKNEFSPFENWTVKEIWVGDNVLTPSDSQELISDFISLAEYAKSVAARENNGDTLYESGEVSSSESAGEEKGFIIDSANRSIKVIFNETDDVIWEMRVGVKRYSDGENKITFQIECFDSYPKKLTKYVEVPQDALFCQYIIKFLFE